MPTINMIVSDSNANVQMYDKDDSMGVTLREVVWQAQEQGRLTQGVHDCARMLEIDPYSAMLCVLPTPGHTGPQAEVSLDIHLMLMEAFCREYDIRLVRVDSLHKMSELVKGRPETCDVTDNCQLTPRVTRDSLADPSCLLVQYPESGCTSEEDEALVQFYKDSVYSDSSHTCHISLPD